MKIIITNIFFMLVACFTTLITFSQGVFAPAAGFVGTTAIHKDSSAIVSWATNVTVTRGLQQYDSSSLGYASAGTEINAIGVADGSTVSLGDSGVAIVTFNNSIHNGTGPDFAIFENGFSATFLELAFVEVSSDGIHYIRFPNYFTLNDTNQIGPFGNSDPTHIHNLAGKYEVFYGTPFDLDEIPDTSILDKNNVSHIKIIDAIGSLKNPQYDTENRKINDPYPTPYPTGGFDLDGVAILQPTIATSIDKFYADKINVYPNPAHDVLNLSSKSVKKIEVYNLSGQLFNVNLNNQKIQISHLNKGVYFIKIYTETKTYVERFVKD